MQGDGGTGVADRDECAGRVLLADRVAVFLLGAALNFNVLTSTFGLPFQRLSDLLPFLLIPWLGLRRAVVAEAVRQAAPSPASWR
ncbi:hypothetical protein R1A27_23385 [Methylobacterium sp. NMS12]|uniref:hypothetical protein n=1 Tax=Methylobacterium sp. NMS12 TaxID=3079766 RepID=UPI003F8819CC